MKSRLALIFPDPSGYGVLEKSETWWWKQELFFHQVSQDTVSTEMEEVK